MLLLFKLLPSFPSHLKCSQRSSSPCPSWFFLIWSPDNLLFHLLYHSPCSLLPSHTVSKTPNSYPHLVSTLADFSTQNTPPTCFHTLLSFSLVTLLFSHFSKRTTTIPPSNNPTLCPSFHSQLHIITIHSVAQAKSSLIPSFL